MKYYRIVRSLDIKEIGVFPQVQTGIIPTSINDPDFIGAFLFEKAHHEVLLPSGKLDSKAKKTDLLSTSFPGLSTKLYVSADLNEILTATKSRGIQHFKTSLILPDKSEEEYWIINPFITDMEFLDFEKCRFAYTDYMVSRVVENITFENSKELINQYYQKRKDVLNVGEAFREFKHLMIEHIVIKEGFDLDFFSLSPIRPGGIGYYVSDNLKKTLEKAKFTGIRFTEMNV